MPRTVVYPVKVTLSTKKWIQMMRIQKQATVEQILSSLIKLAEKYPNDFEHFLWLSRGH